MKLTSLLAITLIALTSLSHAHTSAEIRVNQQLHTIKEHPKQLTTFLKAMPKGADLHNHMSGASYAEHLVQYAANDDFCIETPSFLVKANSSCSEAEKLNHAIQDADFYNQLIDAWSMRHFKPGLDSGHDHFFATFTKFSAINKAHRGQVLAEIAQHAADQNESYVELMTRPDGSDALALGTTLTWNPDLTQLHQQILHHQQFQPILTKISKTLDQDEQTMQQILDCNSRKPQTGCQTNIRYLYEGLREQPPAVVFTQLVVGFEASRQDKRVVGINLVQPEDGLLSMQDYALHMQMIHYLHEQYPDVNISLHAGELTDQLAGPEGLSTHIRDAVNIAHAQRIGHGVDITHETNYGEVLNTMFEKGLLVEINLSSNALILNVDGDQHPLSLYLQHDVPIAFATDDEGVSRSSLTQEYQRAVEHFQLDYFALKNAARNSLQYSFLPGQALWTDKHYQQAAPDCNQEKIGAKHPSAQCHSFLTNNKKAALQWELEQRFHVFEQAHEHRR